MRSLSFYIQPDKEDKSGLVPIIAQVTIKRKNYRVRIGKTKKRYWNTTKKRINKNRQHEPYNDYKELNELINSIVKNNSRFDRFDKYDSLPKLDEVKRVILDVQEDTKSFNEAYDEFIETNRNKVSYNTTRNRNTAKNFIKDYQDYYKITLQFDDMTVEFFEKLYDYAFEVRGILETNKHEMENNTFASYVAKFKSFLEWANEKGYCNNFEHKKYSFTEKEKNVICLTPNEFKALFNYKFKNKSLDKARDLYCFGCLTGLRFSDIASLRKEHLKNGVINKKINKTREESSIPILPQAQAILDKYNDDSFYPLPRLSNQKLNEYIKICCKECGIDTPTLKLKYKKNQITEESFPKYDLITAHTARKTFITIGFMGGMDTKLIKAITGHKKESTFDRYLKIADEMTKEALNKAWKF